jgi:hypothetical protein
MASPKAQDNRAAEPQWLFADALRSRRGDRSTLGGSASPENPVRLGPMTNESPQAQIN